MKLPEGRSWKDYGLESEADAAASYTIMAEKDSSGRYFLHTVYIGGLSGTKSYYYARYIGGLFADNGGESEMVVNLSKDIIYYISASVVTGSLMQPETAMMDPTLIKTVSSANDIYYIDDIRIDIPAAGINAHIRNMSAFIAASNLSANDNSALSKLMSDKVSEKVLKSDIVSLGKHGISGIIEDQTQRSFLPTPFPEILFAFTAFDQSTDTAALKRDVLEHCFGSSAERVSDYLDTLSACFDPAYMRGERFCGGRP